MADRQELPQDLAWYQDRWEELMDFLPTSAPEEVVDHVRELQVSMLDDEAETLDDMGLADADEAKTVLRNIFERLQRLRRKNQSLQHVLAAVGADDPSELVAEIESLQERAHAFEDQQDALAEAGFDQPIYALKALRSMEEQLEALYEEKEATDQTDVDNQLRMKGDTFDQLQALLAREEKLQRELGISSPDAIIDMVDGLSDQLESLYQDRKELSERGMGSFDHALSLIDNMEEQLSELYEERHKLADQQDIESPGEAAARLEELEGELEALLEEKEALREKRNDLHARFDDLRDELGLDDPNAIPDLVRSLEDQLKEVYAEREGMSSSSVDGSRHEEILLDEGTLARLDDMDADALDALPVGLFMVDDEGIVRLANLQALKWPDVEAESPDGIVGKNFFSDIAPGTDNTLFRGRFEEGVAADSMDEPFIYTYVSEAVLPTNLSVHLYSLPDQSTYWIVFSVLEQY